jgi:tRNA nucleotidyltransferase (CCA-adding enzyme)
MMGLAFAEHLSAYADAKGFEAGAISKIAQNPDQSKHLESATFKLGGLDLDLVNLRSEAYAENSRIPTEVVRGTHPIAYIRSSMTLL